MPGLNLKFCIYNPAFIKINLINDTSTYYLLSIIIKPHTENYKNKNAKNTIIPDYLVN